MEEMSRQRERLRGLVTQRLGLASTVLPDFQIDLALKQLTGGREGRSPIGDIDGLESLDCDEPAWQSVIAALVVGETSFFRQPSWFSQLEQHVLSALFETSRRTGTKRLRIWSAACATGEEPYSIAIILDRLVQHRDDWDIRILGTDINATFIEAARRARYRRWSLRELDADVRARYFHEIQPGRFELTSAIRDMVTFETHNLVDAASAERGRIEEWDLIICRNLLMYLSAEHRPAVAGRLAGRLATHGWLAVAPLEAEPAWFRSLARVNVPSAIFFRRDEAAR
jgi:chemotaxis protein methyltransferase CheR